MARNVVPNTGVETIGTPDKRWSAIYADHVYTDDYVNVKQFGAKGDGVTDDTEAIQAAINAKKNLVFPSGVYCISKPVITNATDKISINLNGSVIKAIAGSWSEADYMIVLGGNGEGLTYGQSEKRCELYGGVIDGNHITYGGVKIVNLHFASVFRMSIIQCKTNPLLISVPTDSTSADAYIREVYLEGTDETNSIGLDIQSNDNNIAYVRTAGCYTGIRIGMGGNYLFECHPLGWFNNDPDDNEDVGFVIAGGENNTLTNCYSDGFNVCLKTSTPYYYTVNNFICAYSPYNTKCVFLKNTASYMNGSINCVSGFRTGGTATSNKGYEGQLTTSIGNRAYFKNVFITGLSNLNDPSINSLLAIKTRPPYLVTNSTDVNTLLVTTTFTLNGVTHSEDNHLPSGLSSAYGLLEIQAVPKTEISNGFIRQTIYTQNKVYYRLGTSNDGETVTWHDWITL